MSDPSLELVRELSELCIERAQVREGSLGDHLWYSLKALSGDFAKEWKRLKSELGEEEAFLLVRRRISGSS